MEIRLIIMALVCLCIAQLAFASDLTTRSQDVEKTFFNLTKKLRCISCQNQNVFESNTPSSLQLKQEIYSMLHSGKTETQVRDSLVTKYGNYILYTPPFEYKTILLWLGPILMLASGWWIFRRFLGGMNT